MPVRAVIFDFGGVLVRTEDHSGRRKWEARLSLPEGELDRLILESDVLVRACRGEVPEAAVWEHVATTLGLNASELQQLQHDFWAGDQLDPVLVHFLRELRPRYKTAILSNAWLGARQVFTEEYGLDQVVDEIIISAEEGVIKPEAQIYRVALGRLGVRPEEAVFVDDMAENVRGAQALGMRAVQFRSTPQTLAEVRKYLDEHLWLRFGRLCQAARRRQH